MELQIDLKTLWQTMPNIKISVLLAPYEVNPPSAGGSLLQRVSNIGVRFYANI